MKYYEYDSEGFLLGWHEDPNRPNSTTLEPVGIPPRRAKWNGVAWEENTFAEDKDVTDLQTEKSKIQIAKNKCRNYDPATATATDVKETLAAALYILRGLLKDD